MPFPVENIRKRCADKGITLAELERRTGIGNGVIRRWEFAKGSPPFDRLVRIALELETTVDALQGTEKPAPLIEGGSKWSILLSIFNQLSPSDQDQLLSLAERFEKDSERK